MVDAEARLGQTGGNLLHAEVGTSNDPQSLQVGSVCVRPKVAG